MVSFKSIDPDVLALLAALMAIDLAKGMDVEEQNVFGNFIVAVGSIILTIAAATEAQKKTQEEAKAKTDEKKGEPAKSEEKKAKPAETKPAAEDAKDEQDDILIGRAEHERLRREQEMLQRQLRALERRVAALAGSGK